MASIEMIDEDNEILVGQSGGIRVFDTAGSLLRTIGESGFQPGGFGLHADMAIAPDGRLYAADLSLNRVQSFSTALPAVETRAIVVAGGGPYPGNALWPATELNANLSYAKVAEGCGLKGVQVTTMDDLSSTLQEACQAQAAGVTTFIEVIFQASSRNCTMNSASYWLVR